MSKQVIEIPEHLKKFLANSATSSDAGAMAASSISIPRISLKGRKFRLVVGGEELRKPADELFVIILAVEPGAGLMQKTYYSKGYVQGDSSPPDCSSANGVHPDAWIAEPVSQACRNCDMNRFGSATSNNGKKTKACKDSKRLWVVEPDSIDGTVYALGVPVTSLKAMAEYGSMLQQNNVPAASVITKLSMKDSEFPELQFEYVGVLDQEPCEKAMLRNEQKDWDLRQSGPLLEAPTGPVARPGAATKTALLEDKKPSEEASGEKMSPDKAVGNW